MSFLLYKPVGLTPLQAIQLAKKQFPQYADSLLGVAGRLDPMAEGLLLVMVGEENKNQASYLELHKLYEVDLILGIRSDSYDLLGVPQLSASAEKLHWPSPADVQFSLKKMTGKIWQEYPPYSAVRVKGKPLFWWARQGRLDEVEIPARWRTIEHIEITNYSQTRGDRLLEIVHRRVSGVQGDFRQSETLSQWHDCLSEDLQLPVYSLRIECSSGTYVRSIVHQLGQELGVGAITLNICRTAIGKYELKDALKLDVGDRITE